MNTQIYQEASDWLIKNREGGLDAAAKRHFDAWLRESPQHVRAYLEMSAVWEDVPALHSDWNPDADALIARARGEENVVELSSARHVGREGSGARQHRAMAFYAIAASVLLAVSGAWLYGQRNTYSTDVGEQRSIVLRDGSTIELNSRSRVRVHFSAAERDIDLLAGQALFRVAKDPARPFVVHSDSTRVRAVGTQFDVYRKRTGTIVTVVEGRVAVISEPHPPPLPSHEEGSEDPVHDAQEQRAGDNVRRERDNSRAQAPAQGPLMLLAAGEQLVVTPSDVTFPKRANVAAATAWTRRSLVFESSPLTEVAEEFNRYNTRQLVIADAQLADFHVSGVFSSVDPALLLRFLRTQPELVVEETDRTIRISKK